MRISVFAILLFLFCITGPVGGTFPQAGAPETRSLPKPDDPRRLAVPAGDTAREPAWLPVFLLSRVRARQLLTAG